MEIKENKFSFHHEDTLGKINLVTFEADTWTEALNQFVLFLKGLGFFIENDDIQLHSRRESLDWSGVYVNQPIQRAPTGHWNIQFGDK